MKVYVVYAFFGNEHSAPIRAYAKEEEAQSFAAACNAYHLTEPDWHNFVTEEELEKYSELQTCWCAEHPAGNDHAGLDSFTVIEMEVL